MKIYCQLYKRCCDTDQEGDFLQKRRRFFGALRSARVRLSDTLGFMEPESVLLLTFACRCWGICSLGQFYLGLFLFYQCD